MNLISITNSDPYEQVEPHVKAHMAWIGKGYEAGMFLASGRKVPRTGGVILARGERAEVERVAMTDPFVTEGVASVEVTEVGFMRAAEGFDSLLDKS
jgi:uncharacterized protein YciI